MHGFSISNEGIFHRKIWSIHKITVLIHKKISLSTISCWAFTILILDIHNSTLVIHNPALGINKNATPTPVVATPTPVTGGYVVTYSIANDWGIGATVNVTIKNNTATAVNGWTLGWTFPGNQTITNMWSATYTQSGACYATMVFAPILIVEPFFDKINLEGIVNGYESSNETYDLSGMEQVIGYEFGFGHQGSV